MIGFFQEVDPEKSGGKGKNLIRLLKASFPVPPGFIVTFDVYTRYRESGKMPGETKKIISGYYKKLKQDTGSKMVAVRSSASAEDLEIASFAGQYDTYLYVQSEEELFGRIVDCWNSLFSERAVTYRQRMKINIPGKNLNMAVVVQTMIDPKAAGILFTTHPCPVDGKEEAIIVEANWGCGETVVSGKVTPDHFKISKNEPYTVLEKIPGEKGVFLKGSRLGPVIEKTSAARRNKFSLTDNQLSRLSKIGSEIERYFGAPRDIEWALGKDGRFFILQSRPLTSAKEIK